MKKLTQEEFIERANVIHNQKYDYSLTAYIDMTKSIVVTCPMHGPFNIQACNHVRVLKQKPQLNASGCPNCGKEHTRDRNKQGRLTKERFIEKANIVHLFKYTYPGMYKGMNHKIDIICPHHGMFLQQGINHLRGTGCPRCKNSKGQTKIAKLLTKHSIKYISEYSFVDCLGDKLPLKFDFWLPDKQILIEYDGEQHFGPVIFHQNMTQATADTMFRQTCKYDKIKNKYAELKKLKLIRIPYYERNFEPILLNQL